MKNLICLIFINIILLVKIQAQSYTYPTSKTVDSVDVYFGKSYADPYRWIENLSNTETINWFKAQNEYTEKVLSTMPLLPKIFAEVKEADKVRKIKYAKIVKRDNGYYFEKRTATEQKSKLYFMPANAITEKLIFDPEKFQSNKYEMFGWDVSTNGKKMFINLSEPGKELGLIFLYNVENNKCIDSLVNARGEYWIPNKENQFLYNLSASNDIHSMDATLNTKEMLYNNGVSTEVFSNALYPTLGILPEEYPFIVYFENGNYMFAGRGTVDNNQHLFYAPKTALYDNKVNWKLFCTTKDKITQGICVGNDVYVLTSKNNDKLEVVKYSLNADGVSQPKLVYSPTIEVLKTISRSKNYILIDGVVDGLASKNTKINLATLQVSDITTPLKGIVNVSAWGEKTDNCLITNRSWTTAYNRYESNVDKADFAKSKFYTEVGNTGLQNIVAEEVEVTSHDGVTIPLSIVYDKNLLKKDGSNICYLDGYGAYGATIEPYFSFANVSMLKRGVVLAYAHIRGGGEKGENWHLAGYKTTKPNTWKDFIACGDYLVQNKFTSSDKLGGTGTSAGGILIGRAITERPDLFKVALPRVGCLNALRMEYSPNGPVNAVEFGTLKIEDEAQALAEMDAYLHIQKNVKYPAMLVTTGFNDPRVVSWQPGKFAAAAQNSTASNLPVLLQVNYKGGHFGSANTDDGLKELATEFAFILWQCGYKGE